MNPSDKIFQSLDDLSVFCNTGRGAESKIVLTSGCFDILHKGHGVYVYLASLLGRLIVGINSDAFVRSLKGPDRPYRSQEERAYLIACLEAASGVVVFDDDIALIRAVRPDIYVVSDTSHVRIENDPPRLALVRELGIEVRAISSGVENSTTSLLGKVRRPPQRAESTESDNERKKASG